MAKPDRREQRRLTLECGHTVTGAATAQTKKCRECQRPGTQRVVTVGELVREANERPPRKPQATRVVTRDDGLSVRHFDGLDLKIWWCRFCWGKRPRKPFERRTRGMDSVFADWDRHVVSGGHLRMIGADAAVADVLRQDRSSSGE